MSIEIVSSWRPICIIAFILAGALRCLAQEPTLAGTPTPSPSPYSAQILGELKKLQQAALPSDYAYRQVAHLSNNIGPRLTGSAQAQKAGIGFTKQENCFTAVNDAAELAKVADTLSQKETAGALAPTLRALDL